MQYNNKEWDKYNIINSIENTTRLANFKVTQEIGRGAFSTVYKA